MKKILVATDFSPRSDRALRRAIILARNSGASLILLHVSDDEQPPRLLQAEQDAAWHLLGETAHAICEIENIGCEPEIVLGQAFDGILRVGESEQADLVVIGSHRRQPLRDMFRGTTAERTIRASRRPVLMANAAPGGSYRKVLVAVDFSECSAAAMRTVKDLRLDSHAALSVLHVYEVPALALATRAPLTPEQIGDDMAAEEAGAARRLAGFLERAAVVPAHSLLRADQGSTAAVIGTVAAETSSDLLVIGTSGRSGAARLVLGSVADALVREAACDVMAVPANGAAGHVVMPDAVSTRAG